MATAESSQGGLAESTESTDIEHQSPWPYLDKWVKYKHRVGNSYIFQCLTCLPKTVEVKVNKATKANLKSHFARMHPNEAKQVVETCKVNLGHGGRRSRSLSGKSHEGESSRKKQRQMSVVESFGPMAASKHVLQSTVDEKIVRVVVDNMLPLQIVDSHSFRDLVYTLNPYKEVPSRRTLGKTILKTYEEMKGRLTSELEQVEWVATTADCWSANKKGFLGMTVHWLDPNTRDRKMAVLACERIMGSHTNEALAQAMAKIHSEFGIENKVTSTTTDNAANFNKAFVQFSADLDVDQGVKDRASEAEDTDLEELIADPTEAAEDQDLEFVVLDDMENSDDEGSFQLPKHQKCAAHTLNLVATTDIMEKKLPDSYKKPFRAALAKAQALWNKQGTSTVFADNLYKAIKRRLTVPTQTRWNSLYDSLVVLLKVLEEKKDEVHKCMLQQKNLPVFVQNDIDVMSEYVKVMAAVANALDHIQGEKQCYLGCLIPTIIVVQKRLTKMKTSGSLRFCGPLVTTLLASVERRFANTFEDEQCLLATAFHPKFRLKWMGAFEETMVKTLNKATIKSMMEKTVEEFMQREELERATTNSSSSDADNLDTAQSKDFYDVLSEDEQRDTGGRRKSIKSRSAQMVKVWLEGKGTDSMSDAAFNSEKVLIDLFTRYNTAMPSSAAVERLFSLGKDIYRAKRSCLSDDTFNILLFLKGNMKCRQL